MSFFAVPCKVTKRTSRSANAQKRRSFLPTPLRSDRITRSQSLRSRPGSSDKDNAPLPFNISPSAELVKPRRPAVQAPADHNLESLRSNSRLSDPFSPASQMTIVDPVQDSTGSIGGDAVVRNLIEWSPALPKEVRDLENAKLFPWFNLHVPGGGGFLGPVLTSNFSCTKRSTYFGRPKRI